MKKSLITMTAVISLAVSGYAQEKSAENKKLGVELGVDYYSNYLWRGGEFYNRSGALIPAVSWTPFESGLTLSLALELSMEYLWNGFTKKPDKYYWTGTTWYKKKQKINNLAYANQSFDIGAEYSYTIKESVTVGASFWYYWFFNAQKARELGRLKIGTYTPSSGPMSGIPLAINKYQKLDVSYLSPTLWIAVPAVPYINPKLSVTADYYTGLKRGLDWYAQLGVSHDFILVKDVVTLTPSLTAGYYYSRTSELTNYYYDDSLAWIANTRGWWRQRTPLKKGFSDVTPSISMKVTKGPASLNAGFYWIMVPAKSWYKGSSIHRYYAQLGGTLNF